MRRLFPLSFSLNSIRFLRFSTATPKPPIVRIENGTFYRNYPSSTGQATSSNPAILPDLNFSLDSYSSEQQHWAVIGPSNSGKTTLFEVLRGKHVCLPPAARSFPYLLSDKVEPQYRSSLRAIQYVGFDGERGGVGKAGTRGAYLSARYESRRENTDFSVMDYLKGNTDLNPSEEKEGKYVNDRSLQKVIDDLRLEVLINMPMGSLSNGQTRRARIARALLGKPMVLLLDEPFMGLDPPTMTTLSPLLHSLAKENSPRLVLALRPQDPLPDWITHVIQLGPSLQVSYQGTRESAPESLRYPESKGSTEKAPSLEESILQIGLPAVVPPQDTRRGTASQLARSREGLFLKHRAIAKSTEILIEMQDIHVKYGDKEVLGDWEEAVFPRFKENMFASKPVAYPKTAAIRKGLWWKVRRGDRWGAFGPNGSGKTTLISLICSDHPQTYSLPIKIFGRSRLPQQGQPGISIFDIQARIGQSSPEIHAFFPRNLSIRQTIENAWADTFLGTPRLTYENDVAVDACLRWFEAELNPTFDPKTSEIKPVHFWSKVAAPRNLDWADDLRFADSPFSAQRVALFLRAIIKRPDLIVLDEAFSGMDAYVRDKCMLFLTWGETKSFAFGVDENGHKKRFVTSTNPLLLGETPLFRGLHKDQALICVSHVKEEVPGVVREWLCLPEAGTGKPARFGRFKMPLDADKDGWKEVWGV